MFYSVAKNQYMAGCSSLSEEQAQALALKYGPMSVVTPDGCHEYVMAREFWPQLFGEIGAGTNWCPDCQRLFSGEWEYANGFQLIRCDCGKIVRQIIAARMDRQAPIRRDEHDPTDPFSI